MNKRIKIECPICNNDSIEELLNIYCGGFDNSFLYKNLIVNSCKRCGHIFNELSPEKIDALSEYYENEYALFNISLSDEIADKPGGNTESSNKRYSFIYGLVSKYINNDDYVLDVGCAKGGFINYLKHKGFSNVYGIDLANNFVEYVSTNKKLDVRLGGAESIPFDNNFFDLIIIDQVLEHTISPLDALKEAKRTLKKGGLLYIGIPDASRYFERAFFELYWLLLREHIQHFDSYHLNLLAQMEEFRLVQLQQNEISLTAELSMPSLSALYKLSDDEIKISYSKDLFILADNMRNYISLGLKKLLNRRTIFEEIRKLGKGIIVWGISNEFFYLYEQAGLKNCNILALIDANPTKQANFTVDGRAIQNPSILKQFSKDTLLIITAFAHRDAIEKHARQISYKGEILYL